MKLTFDQVRQELDSLRQVSYVEAESLLERAQATTTHAALVAAYAPQHLGEIRGMNLLEEPGTEMAPLEEIVYHMLFSLFPCNVDSLFQEILDGEAVPGLIIDPVFNFSSEEFGDMVMDPENFGSSELSSLLIFVRYLGLVVDAHYFELAAEYFDWPVDAPECCTATESIDTVDMPRFYALLQEHSLDEFKLPFQCSAQETGNIFLDWTLDEAYNEYIPYSMASIRDLVHEWELAKPRVEQMEAAAQRFKKDRWIASKIIELWDRCIRYKDGRVPRTLVEMWGIDADGDVEVVADEFYGPVGVEVDDD